MPINYYKFVDKFIVPCDIKTAYYYIKKIEEYPRWWGKVYKTIIKIKDAPEDQPGARYRITIVGFLPYSLTIENEITHIDKPTLIKFDALGDLQGKGIWTFCETRIGTEITFDWRVAANKAVIRRFSFFLKPLFRANHIYCIKKANEGMRKDLVLKKQFSTSL